jgi:concanavalin A-like lectin/glucanase superfamily protein
VPPVRELGGRIGALTATLALLGASGTADAATLKAEYQLHGSRASQVAGAPDLADIGAANHFATETVGGAPRQVLVFARGGGVSLRTAGLVDPISHSVVMVFRLSDVAGFRRLLDFSGGVNDDGLYVVDGEVGVQVGGWANTGSGPGSDPGAGLRVTSDAFVQVTLTSEATLAGTQWTVAYVDGTPVTALTTTDGFGLDSGVLRLFRDNIKGPARGEQSAGALACVLLYDGALTSGEVRQDAADPALCPAPKPPPPPHLSYRTGDYEGTTSQGLPISFTVQQGFVQDISFEWRARCADGHVHTNGIGLGGASIRNGRFSTGGVLDTGAHATVSGRIRGSRARGTLSRWGNSAFNTSCPDRGVRWRAHLVAAGQGPALRL